MEATEITYLATFCYGIVSAKWAMELGFSQLSQLIWFVFGTIAAPLALLILYLRHIRSAKSRFVGSPKADTN